jgi:hypothetical protein
MIARRWRFTLKMILVKLTKGGEVPLTAYLSALGFDDDADPCRKGRQADAPEHRQS